MQSICASVAKSPLVGIFQAGYAELNTQLRRRRKAAADGEPKPAGRLPRVLP